MFPSLFKIKKKIVKKIINQRKDKYTSIIINIEFLISRTPKTTPSDLSSLFDFSYCLFLYEFLFIKIKLKLIEIKIYANLINLVVSFLLSSSDAGWSRKDWSKF